MVSSKREYSQSQYITTKTDGLLSGSYSEEYDANNHTRNDSCPDGHSELECIETINKCMNA